MAVYRYRARTSTGDLQAGELEALSRADATEQLHDLELFPIAIEPAQAAPAAKPTAAPGKRVSPKLRAAFWRQAAQAQIAGLSMHRTLLLLADAHLGPLSAFAGRAAAGPDGLLSTRMDQERHLFGPIDVGLIRAGEASGRIDVPMAKLAALAEREMAIRQAVAPKLAYLGCVGVAAVLFCFVLLVIVPALMRGEEITAGLFFTRLLLPAALALGAGVVLRGLWFATPALRLTVSGASLSIPVVGNLLRKLAIARFAAVLSQLVEAGVPLGEALELATGALGNPRLAAQLAPLPERVREGEPLSALLQQSGVFPAQVVQMVATGEETGQTAEMLGKVADYYEGETTATSFALASVATAALLFGMALLVGALVIRGAMGYAGMLDGLMGP
jgi:type IV pilus assembly protein PilC